MDQRKPPLVRLNQGGTMLHPVTIVTVEHVAVLSQARLVNVTTDDAVKTALARIFSDDAFKCRDMSIGIIETGLTD